MNFSRSLKIIRAAKELSQQELAKKLGVSKSLVSLIESGDRNMSEELVQLISDKLCIPKELILLLATEESHRISTVDKLKVGKLLLDVAVNSYGC